MLSPGSLVLDREFVHKARCSVYAVSTGRVVLQKITRASFDRIVLGKHRDGECFVKLDVNQNWCCLLTVLIVQKPGSAFKLKSLMRCRGKIHHSEI